MKVTRTPVVSVFRPDRQGQGPPTLAALRCPPRSARPPPRPLACPSAAPTSSEKMLLLPSACTRSCDTPPYGLLRHGSCTAPRPRTSRGHFARTRVDLGGPTAPTPSPAPRGRSFVCAPFPTWPFRWWHPCHKQHVYPSLTAPASCLLGEGLPNPTGSVSTHVWGPNFLGGRKPFSGTLELESAFVRIIQGLVSAIRGDASFYLATCHGAGRAGDQWLQDTRTQGHTQAARPFRDKNVSY